MNVLDVKALRVRYETGGGAEEVIKDISFTVRKGEIAGLVGESGSGKSTAMLAVTGLLGGRGKVQAQRIEVCGSKPVPGRNVAMIFQDTLSCLNPSVTVGRQLAETVRARRGCGRKEAREQSEELLEMVGIRNPSVRMRQYPFELSGGMRQRVVIAAALACEPELIIADEPTTALDAVVQAQILLLLKRIVRETGTSLLLVSHDMGVTAAMCSRVYVMHGGRIVESGTVEDVFYSPQDAYTGKLLDDARGRYKRRKASPDEVLLEMKGVSKTFDAGEGVHDLSLKIHRGEIFALVGESGSGKTTVARILTGMRKEDAGTLSYQGETLDKRRRMDAFKGRVQMVFQEPYASLNPALTVRQTLSEALAGGGNDGGKHREKTDARQDSAEDKIKKMLELTGLSSGDAGRYPRELSGGQRQRLGIARALIVEPDLLVCDEALSSLDATTREQILGLLFSIQERIGFACLFISHDIHLVRRVSDRIAVMYGGHIVETGPTKKVCSDPWHPYTKQLVESVPEPDPLRASKIRAYPAKDDALLRPGGCPFAGRCGYASERCEKTMPEARAFDTREISCLLYAETGRREKNYRMISQI